MKKIVSNCWYRKSLLYQVFKSKFDILLQRIESDMATQRQKILERVAARKKQTMDKETEQLKAMQLVMMAESQQKEQLEAVQREKSHQGSEVRVKVTNQLEAVQREKSHQGSEVRVKIIEHQKVQLEAVQRDITFGK